jgi:hypothetical protein
MLPLHMRQTRLLERQAPQVTCQVLPWPSCTSAAGCHLAPRCFQHTPDRTWSLPATEGGALNPKTKPSVARGGSTRTSAESALLTSSRSAAGLNRGTQRTICCSMTDGKASNNHSSGTPLTGTQMPCAAGSTTTPTYQTQLAIYKRIVRVPQLSLGCTSFES